MYIFPAYAGLNLVHHLFRGVKAHIPRIRGVEPGGFFDGLIILGYSPHTRG